jgi:hypothetical protein
MEGVMKDDKIVVRCKDNKIMKGKVYDFSATKVFFSMRLLSGERVKIKIAE